LPIVRPAEDLAALARQINAEHEALEQKLSLGWGEYYQRRMDRAHRRYLSAIKTLALVRKLAVPVLQVNIARKQVNVASPCVAADSERGTP
jgi:hypothetical protein